MSTYHEQLTGQQVPFQKVGVTLSSASSITPTAAIHPISGIVAISTINVPYAGWTGQVTLIPTGIWATNLLGNIGLASVAVVGKILILTYDGTKWWPNY